MGTGLPGGSESQLITVSEAVAMVGRFRAANAANAATVVRAWGFGRAAIDAVLAQPGCAGIRIYRGHTDVGAEQVLIVGLDTTGNDLLPASASGTVVVADKGWPCPPLCGGASVLNS